jgi:hypothetical protein
MFETRAGNMEYWKRVYSHPDTQMLDGSFDITIQFKLIFVIIYGYPSISFRQELDEVQSTSHDNACQELAPQL